MIRREILRLLGCAPCVPLLTKEGSFFNEDGWMEGKCLSASRDDTTSGRKHNLVGLLFQVSGKTIVPPPWNPLGERWKLDISCDGIAGSYDVQAWDSKVSYKSYRGLDLRQSLMCPRITTGFYVCIRGGNLDFQHYVDRWQGKRVHFKLEAS